MKQILDRPATTLLLALNIGLAICYKVYNVPHHILSESYDSIVHKGQIYKSLTAGTAHFELFHIGFNMMSLESLGMELEKDSIDFLFRNLSLLPITSIIMIILIYIQTNYISTTITSTDDRRMRIQQQSHVGYSGVLFALMVISCLERSQTCPIFLIPDLCFPTYAFFGNTIKFNISPVITLVFCQVIMPRVSFVGHLSGILAGFMIHWNLLPMEYTSSPQVLFPLISILHYYYYYHHNKKHRAIQILCKSILYRVPRITTKMLNESSNHNSTKEEEEEDDLLEIQLPAIQRITTATTSFHTTNNGELSFIFCTTKHVLVVTACIFPLILYFCFNLQMSISFVLSELMLLISFASILPFYCFHQNEQQQQQPPQEDACSNISKRFILIAVLTIITDAMTMGGYISEYNYQLDKYYCVKLGVLLFRALIHVVCLCILCYTIREYNVHDNRGVFFYTCGWIQKYGFICTEKFLQLPSSNLQFAPFQGKGVTLGTYAYTQQPNNVHTV